jgi:outer membrane protein assembly factor BamB
VSNVRIVVIGRVAVGLVGGIRRHVARANYRPAMLPLRPVYTESNMTFLRALASLALVISASAISISAGPTRTWPGFRGANSSGVADASHLPVQFGPGKNLLWKVALPPGYSSPVLSETRVFLTAYEGDKLYTMALDRKTGKTAWKKEAPRARVTKRPVNTPVSSTPVTDGENVYVFFEDFGVLSYAPDGTERWRYPMPAFNAPYGMGSSPILVDGKVVMACDQDTDSFLLALNQKDGKAAWKTERPESTHSFSTPIVYRPAKGPAEIILSGAYQIAAYSAQTGEKLWWVWGMAWQSKSTPVIGGDTLYVHSWMANMSELGMQKDDVPTFAEVLKQKDADKDGRLSKDEAPDPGMKPVWFLFDLNKDGYIDEREWEVHRKRAAARSGLYAIRLGGKGDVTTTHVLWKYEKSLPNIPSPVLYKNVIYVLREGGILTSLDVATGKPIKQARLEGAVDPYFSSPVAADNKIYTVSKSCKVAVVKAAGEWELLAVNDLDEECWATPAIADDHLYIRTQNSLYCFGEEDPRG